MKSIRSVPFTQAKAPLIAPEYDLVLYEYAYIVLPYAKHGCLIDYLMKHEKRIPYQLRLYFFKQILLAVYELHKRHGLAHLDLKPDNLVITDDFKIALIDFANTENY